MPDPTTQLAEAFTWYSTGLRDLVQDLLDETGLDTASDTVDDLCGELWLHAVTRAVSHGRSFTELLDMLDAHAELVVGRLRDRPPVTSAGRLDTAADTVDVAELVTDAIVDAERRPFRRTRPRGGECHRPQRTAA
ncbi:hypothetical protein ACIQI7_32260 [Kitasatospora sp. NPDC092039]|uniref:hypothetical protein n=1 Tax=Kitasatospora sp. NPDC092039 TaxID=3364086 RepID=UPI0037FBFDC3